jgi:hypothetical protein
MAHNIATSLKLDFHVAKKDETLVHGNQVTLSLQLLGHFS